MKSINKSMKFRNYTESLASKTEFTNDAQIVRTALEAELDAASFYEQLAKKAKSQLLRTVLLDVANEEKVHAAEFQRVLLELDPEAVVAIDKAEKEVKDLHKVSKKSN